MTRKKTTPQAHTTQVKKKAKKKRAGGDPASRALNSVVTDLRSLSPEKREQVLRSVSAFYGGKPPREPSDSGG